MSDTLLYQLQPFNACRFDDCLAYLSHKHGRALSLYESVKLHVMIDVYHVIGSGKPVIGGHFALFPNGPVARPAETRFNAWRDRYNETEQPPTGFEATETERGLAVRGSGQVDADDFSDDERAAMDRAWAAVVPTLDEGWLQSQRFFHSGSFVGRAWKSARRLGRPLDWNVILSQYDQENGTAVREAVAVSLAL